MVARKGAVLVQQNSTLAVLNRPVPVYIQAPCSMCNKRGRILGPFLRNLTGWSVIAALYILVVPKVFSFLPRYMASDTPTRFLICFFLGWPIVMILALPLVAGIQSLLGKVCPSCDGRGTKNVLLEEHKRKLQADLPSIPQVLVFALALCLLLQAAVWLVSGKGGGLLPLIASLAAAMAIYRYPRNKLKALELEAAPSVRRGALYEDT
jgi:hypothetical protein